MRQNQHFNPMSSNNQYQSTRHVGQFNPINQRVQSDSMMQNEQFIRQSGSFQPTNQFNTMRQNEEMISSKRQPKPFFKQWFSPNQSLRESQSSDLMGKVPKEMRSSLKRQKSVKQTMRLDNFYEGLKNALDPNAANCSICLDTLKNPCSISSCNHRFCSECVINYLTFKINAMEEIFCPHEDCDLKVDFNSNGWKSLPQEYKQKYKKQELWRQTIKNPDLKLCPSEKCEQGTINLRKIPLTCQKCRTIFCQECMMVDHPRKQCDQNFRQNFKEWKRCPNCQMFIEKTQGCNHMVCRCKNEFCFVCLETWKPQHYSCVQDRESDFIGGEGICCPKFFAVLMGFFLPVLIILGIASVPLFAAVVFLAGFFFFLCVIGKQSSSAPWFMCLVIFSPLIIVFGAIGLSLWATFFYYVPVVRQYIGFYTRNITNLWNQQ